jgi:integrase
MSIRKTPTGRYEVRWREGGRRHGRTFDRLADARVFETEIRRRRQLGGLLSADLDITLERLAAEWWVLHVEPNLAASTQLHYARVRDLHLLPHLGQYKLREISPRLVNRFRADLLRNGVGAPTARKTLAVLQSMLAFAVQEERIESNPVAKIRKPSGLPTRVVRPLPPLTVERLRRRLPMEGAALVSVLAYAGLRPGEALGLRWSDVGARVLSIERAASLGVLKTTKTGRTRHVRLLTPLADDLAEWRAAGAAKRERDLVFARSDGAPWTLEDWDNWRNRTFKPLARRLGFPDARPYDLRASFVSLLHQAGHSPETCLRHYARAFAEHDPEHRVGAEGQIRAARWRAAREMDARLPGDAERTQAA